MKSFRKLASGTSYINRFLIIDVNDGNILTTNLLAASWTGCYVQFYNDFPQTAILQEKLASLPPLCVPKKPIGLQSSTGTLSLDELGGEASEDLKKLSKDAHNVLGASLILFYPYQSLHINSNFHDLRLFVDIFLIIFVSFRNCTKCVQCLK